MADAPGNNLAPLNLACLCELFVIMQISDGERRRVQLCMGLMAMWDVLLLDEVCFIPWHGSGDALIVWQVTVDLDVLVRDDLLTFLKQDSVRRRTTILCKNDLYCGNFTPLDIKTL